MKRFTDNNDGTITDTKTGLTWMKDANLFGKLPWVEAVKKCTELSEGWRLPERFELESLLDLTQHAPALPEDHPFINVQSYLCWSGTSYVGSTNYAWTVYIYYGSVDFYDKSFNFCVWPVRGKNE